MSRLKKIIDELEEQDFESIKSTLVKNKADNFLFVFQSYRGNEISDDDIMAHLELNKNSLYVLKSRLYEKIQSHVTGDISLKKEDALMQLQQINDICYNSPRGIAIAFLLKLEKELLLFDMHYELRMVYSALKKLHLYSEKYFHYSQLYNKQIALGVSLDKCEELLGDFNRILAQYNFSRSQSYIENLLFLKKEILNHYALNPSRQIALIRNICDLQLMIFCDVKPEGSGNVRDLFASTRQIISELPTSSPFHKWDLLLDYLSFEMHLQAKELQLAGEYYDKVYANINNLLLYTGICNTSRFLISGICYLQECKRTSELAQHDIKSLNYDPDDTHTKVLLCIYEAMLLYYSSDIKQATKSLVEAINVYSFKDFFHINLEIKLTLAFFYFKIKDVERAQFMLNTVSRKIKSEKLEEYANTLNVIKLLNNEAGAISKSHASKQQDLLTIFIARNHGSHAVIPYLISELQSKYL